MIKQTQPVRCSFRPADTNAAYQGLLSSPKLMSSVIADGPQAPEVPTPSILPAPVDVSQYEYLSYEDWLLTPVDYTSSSPPPMDTDTISPIALRHPGMDPFLDYYYDAYATQKANAFTEDISDAMDVKPPVAMSTLPRPQGLPSLMPITNLPPREHLHGGLEQYYVPARQIASVSPQDVEPAPLIETPSDNSSSYGSNTLETTTPSNESAQSTSESDNESEANIKSKHDAILVKMREEGYSYKEIKEKANLSIAESTLRGRYRTLTKHASERVRKPQWKDSDISLLHRGVARFQRKARNKKGHSRPHGRGGLPWEKIGEWMDENGSSYHFGPATCAKKWQETKHAV